MASKEFYKSVANMSGSHAVADSKTEKKQSAEKDHSDKPHDILGEPGTGYEDRVVDGVDKGEFECENCSFFVGPVGGKGAKRGEKGCNQLDMRQKSKREKFPDGRVKVDPEGCCSWVDRIGKIEPEAKEKKEGESKKGTEPAK